MATENPTPETSMTDAPDFQSFVSKKIAAGICGILLGSLGIHKFILGFTTPGIIMLSATVACGILGACLIFPFFGSMAMGVIGIIEGVMYLTKSDQDFYDTYAVQKKEWF